jgi:hypothetical protein
MDDSARRMALARHIELVALVLEALVLLSLLIAAIPLALVQPVWWLRLFDSLLNLAPVLLLAVILLRIGSVINNPESADARISAERGFALAGRWAWIFALLVPLQLAGFAWLWADSDSQLNRQINQGERNVAALRSRIGASSSEAELRSLLVSANLSSLQPLRAGALPDQKQQISDALAIQASQLSSSLREQRAETLRNSLPGSLRVLFGAAIVSAYLFMLRRQI